ncbi:alpha-1,2-mannosidase [Parazoarcus communis]|uniref:Alpha-1,2-mannosidase n=1 Tax=Parazoarcus communis TaxID=41977 RepID=A0A2U8GKI3_9RHOO|nr:alpha-1,2-mannosidase [Parazoarcus communis]AWI74052.1 alpha-1,2-mannosidase [Parazoarcus communis]
MISLPAIVRRLEAWLPVLAWGLALSVAAWTCATVFWQLTAPDPVSALPSHTADPRSAARDIVRALGSGESEPAPHTQVHTDYQLIGLATGFGQRPGFALLRRPDGETLALLQDETLADGLRLVRILPDRIELAADGRTVALHMTGADSTTSPVATSDTRTDAISTD